MKITIIGIDGLEKNIIDQYIDQLPNFKNISDNGTLSKIQTVFPADSVPAWNTIFTGLDPSEHGIVRGKDYVESLQDYENNSTFKLEGKTFWDAISKQNKKVLVLNPYLAYPPWKIDGVFVSGPAFVKGETIAYPEHHIINNPGIFGGYEPISNQSLVTNIALAQDHTTLLKEELKTQLGKDNYDLVFCTFTTLDRIQHYTWRYHDQSDPLHEKHPILSNSIFETIKILDNLIGDTITAMKGDDSLIIISDHGFAQRPYKLINLNEVLRREALLLINKKDDGIMSLIINKIRNISIKVLSKLKLLDIIALKVKGMNSLNKFKKSSFMIDRINSKYFTDDYFNGKKPYCGINVGKSHGINLTDESRGEFIIELMGIFKKYDLPTPLWMRWNDELYEGKYASNYPDICFELPSEYGIEYDLYGEIITRSVTHYKISGGHLSAGTFGFFSKDGSKRTLTSIKEFHKFILSLSRNENPISK